MTQRMGLVGVAPSVVMAPVRPVTTAERALYEDVWASIDTYGDHSPGEARLEMFRTMTGAKAGSVLDAGAGSGKGAVALAAAGLTPTLLDLTDAGLGDDAQRFPFIGGCLWSEAAGVDAYEYVYCCDVLEHIPTEYTMLTVQRLLDAARVGVFLSIALVPDQCGIWVGKHLHQTVQPFTWWRDRLKDLGTLVEARDLIDSGVYWVTPR